MTTYEPHDCPSCDTGTVRMSTGAPLAYLVVPGRTVQVTDIELPRCDNRECAQVFLRAADQARLHEAGTAALQRALSTSIRKGLYALGELGMSQRAVAQRLGMSEHHLSAASGGKATASPLLESAVQMLAEITAMKASKERSSVVVQKLVVMTHVKGAPPAGGAKTSLRQGYSRMSSTRISASGSAQRLSDLSGGTSAGRPS